VSGYRISAIISFINNTYTLSKSAVALITFAFTLHLSFADFMAEVAMLGLIFGGNIFD
jgi:hypothetical protein